MQIKSNLVRSETQHVNLVRSIHIAPWFSAEQNETVEHAAMIHRQGELRAFSQQDVVRWQWRIPIQHGQHARRIFVNTRWRIGQVPG